MSLADLDATIEFSAAPSAVRVALERLAERAPDLDERIDASAHLGPALVAVCGASRALSVQVVADEASLDILTHLDARPPLDASSVEALRTWKQREYLRIAARDLLGLDPLPVTVASISTLARQVLQASVELTPLDAGDRLAVIGMGKLGGHELNYASDIDVMFIGEGDAGRLERAARRVMQVAKECFRIDANLRPQGRDGPLVRTLGSYEAYWQRWAEPWEFQALLKARAAAGDEALREEFDASASEHLWRRAFTADDLRQLRHLKARTEAQLARQGLTDREVKRGRGGIRDVEFAVQLLQLVHGRLDERLRSPNTLAALDELASSGYVEREDARGLADAYVFLRRLEHRLQLYDGAQVYAMPVDEASRTRIARSMGFRDHSRHDALSQLDDELGRHQRAVRSAHERLYFRPLLEAFAQAEPALLVEPGALDARLQAFGFSDGLRTRAAIRELTRGLTRSSRLMQQLLPLLLGWLSDTPDPDLGLLCLRNLVGDRDRAAALTRAFRDSPEVARRMCVLLGTTRLSADMLTRNPDLAERLDTPERLQTAPRHELEDKGRLSLELRREAPEQQAALRRWKERNLFGIVARDVLGIDDARRVGRDLTAVAEACVEVALEAVEPKIPFAVIALGRFGGGELSYASDLDLAFVYDGSNASDAEEGFRVATTLRRFLQGETPAHRLFEVDVDLRPEGRQGPIARSLDGYAHYFERWALVWERQAMLRARPVAGNVEVGGRILELLDEFVWAPGLSDDDRREIRRIKARVERERIRPGEDPDFHLKLGRGSISDVEWTVQLLQLQHGVRGQGTLGALDALVAEGRIAPDAAEVLSESYRFCETVRNRLFLVRSAPSNSLPQDPSQLLWLARSMSMTPSELRERYRKVTRRARGVMERLFYGRS